MGGGSISLSSTFLERAHHAAFVLHIDDDVSIDARCFHVQHGEVSAIKAMGRFLCLRGS